MIQACGKPHAPRTLLFVGDHQRTVGGIDDAVTEPESGTLRSHAAGLALAPEPETRNAAFSGRRQAGCPAQESRELLRILAQRAALPGRDALLRQHHPNAREPASYAALCVVEHGARGLPGTR